MGTPDLIDSYGIVQLLHLRRVRALPATSRAAPSTTSRSRTTAVEAELLGPVNSLSRRRRTTAGTESSTTPRSRSPSTSTRPRRRPHRHPGADRGPRDRASTRDWVKVDFDLLPLIGSVSGHRPLPPQAGATRTSSSTSRRSTSTPRTRRCRSPTRRSFGAEIARDIGSVLDQGPALRHQGLRLRHPQRRGVRQAGGADPGGADGAVRPPVVAVRGRALLLLRLVHRPGRPHAVAQHGQDPPDARASRTCASRAISTTSTSGWTSWWARSCRRSTTRRCCSICSDHGFAQFGRQFHLNTWLRDNGYLTLKTRRGEEGGDGDHRRRLEPHRGLRHRLQRPLPQPRGPRGQGHRRAPTKAEPSSLARLTPRARGGRRPRDRTSARSPRSTDGTSMYTGEATPSMPELLVGYTPGYRSSSPSVLGATGQRDRSTSTPGPGAATTRWPATWSRARSCAEPAGHPGRTRRSSTCRSPSSTASASPKPEQMVGTSVFDV